MWHGGAVAGGCPSSSSASASSSAIYCPPSNADRVLKVRLDGVGVGVGVGSPSPPDDGGAVGTGGVDDGGVVETIGPDLSWSGGRNKWYGE